MWVNLKDTWRQMMTWLKQRRSGKNLGISRTSILPAYLAVLFVLACGLSSSYAQNTPPAGTVHSVVLTWQAPNPVGGSGTIAGYNVYRATTGVNYAKVNAVLVTGLTTTDAAVVSGTTYGYCATTVDSVGSESPCTIPVNAAVPGNPNIPTSFSATAH